MKKILALISGIAGRLLFPFLTVISCDLIDLHWEPLPIEEKPKALLSCAVLFPDGYDWRRDSLAGSVPCRLVFMQDSSIVLSLTEGDSTQVCAAADMHRIIGGHLFTDYSTSGKTIIKKDGNTLFSFDGRETIRDMIVCDSCIFTLGERRNGSGWAFRKNGAIVLEGDRDSELVGKMVVDRDKVYFGYCDRISSTGSSEIRRYYCAEDGVPEQIPTSGDISRICAIDHFDGKLQLLAESSLVHGLLWQDGSKTTALEIPSHMSDWRSVEFIRSSSSLYCHAQTYSFNNTFEGLPQWTDSFWERERILEWEHPFFQCVKISEAGDGLCFLARHRQMSDEWLMVSSEKGMTALNPRYKAYCGGAIYRNGDGIWLGVNDTEDNHRPVIIHGRDTLKFNFNGFFTCFSLP